MSELNQQLLTTEKKNDSDSDDNTSDEEKTLNNQPRRKRSKHGYYCYCDECKLARSDRQSTEAGLITTSLGLFVFSIAFFVLFTVNKAQIRLDDDRTNALYFFGFLWIGILPFFTYFACAQYKKSEEFKAALSLTSTRVCIAMIPFFALLCLFLVVMFEKYGFLPVNRYDCYPQGTCSKCLSS